MLLGFCSFPGIIIPRGFLIWDCISTQSIMFGLVSGKRVSSLLTAVQILCFSSKVQWVDRTTWTSFQLNHRPEWGCKTFQQTLLGSSENWSSVYTGLYQLKRRTRALSLFHLPLLWQGILCLSMEAPLYVTPEGLVSLLWGNRGYVET